MTNRIEALRNEKRMTQEQLSIALNITQATVSGYETGKQNPSLPKLIQMSDIFHVSIDYILARSNIRNAEDESSLTAAEREQRSQLLDIFRRLGSKNKAVFLAYGQGLLDSRTNGI